MEMNHYKSIISQTLKLYKETEVIQDTRKGWSPGKTSTRQNRMKGRFSVGDQFTSAGIAQQISSGWDKNPSSQGLVFWENMD